MAHIAVLQKEVSEYLDPRPGKKIIDGTCGAIGHARQILEKIGKEGKLLCLDLDSSALSRAQESFGQEINEGRVILVNDNFANLEKIVSENNFIPVSGILVDLGMSSDQLETSGRGFSFLKDEPLDMRYSSQQELTAREIINLWLQPELEKILREYGEEKLARQISRQLIKERKIKPILTTQELVAAIGRGVPERFKHDRLHFATRTFQALRITVNNELENLQEFLPQAFGLLDKGGRLVVISFHSLEDRIVKNFFRDTTKDSQAQILTKKPVVPAAAELASNPRSRSAKLRALRKP